MLCNGVIMCKLLCATWVFWQWSSLCSSLLFTLPRWCRVGLVHRKPALAYFVPHKASQTKWKLLSCWLQYMNHRVFVDMSQWWTPLLSGGKDQSVAPYIVEDKWEMTKARKGQVIGAVALAVANLVGVLWLSAELAAHALSGPWIPVLQVYAASFFAIPAFRFVWILPWLISLLQYATDSAH